ncbi:MAG: hypothetical protein B7C24_04115 [Bacteroidetes bacterium 4572_77]|nr:MAG: hypothetical protein B7C24_04115 [Bacteroidetes bacterium 4572_77]
MILTKELEQLADFRRANADKFHFYPPLSLEEIVLHQEAYSYKLPASYVEFSNWRNGGMLTEKPDHYYIDMLDFEPDGPKWSSFYFYPKEEMMEKINELSKENWPYNTEKKRFYPIIPFCRLPGWGNEFLFFISQHISDKESAVYVRTLDNNRDSCYQIAESFPDFLKEYISANGFPEVYDKQQENATCSSLLKKEAIAQKMDYEKTEKDTIMEATARISLRPNDSFEYCSRGNAYSRSKQSQKALADFNKALQLQENDAFYHHCRGDLLLQMGHARKALIDLDIASRLEPEDSMYRLIRAEAFLQLGKTKKALEDCNYALQTDPKDELGLLIRIKVWKALGEDKKAKEDRDCLDSL